MSRPGGSCYTPSPWRVRNWGSTSSAIPPGKSESSIRCRAIPNDVWVEIGAGHGEMTHLLAGRGRRVVTIETDARLAENLRQRIQAHPDRVAVRSKSSPEMSCSSTLASSSDGDRFRVYGNLPYYITSPILHQLFGYAEQIASIHIVIQFEVAAADRRSPRPPRIRLSLGRLPVLHAARNRSAHSARRVSPAAARYVRTRPHDAARRAGFPGRPATKRNFSNSCRCASDRNARRCAIISAPSRRTTASTLPFDACGLRPDARAEQLSLAQFSALFSEMSAEISGK